MNSKYLMILAVGIVVGAAFKGLLIVGGGLFLVGSASWSYVKFKKARSN